MTIETVIHELELFSTNIISLYPPMIAGKSKEFEEKYKLSLPEDYKYFIRKYNGLELMGTKVYGIYTENTSNSLEESYIFEHWKAGNPMPLYLIPFSPDGRGNHYCFDSRYHHKNSCRIVFWQHDYFYTEDDVPDIDSISFTHWIKQEVIDLTLEDYNYDGTKKDD